MHSTLIARLTMGLTLAVASVLTEITMSSLAQGRPPGQLVGSYHSLTQHPRVFTTMAELVNLARRVSVSGSYSQRRFAILSHRIATDLADDTRWDVAYAGCNIDTYLYAFSYELIPAHEVEKLRAELKLDAGVRPPVGAAVVAARLALYATLVQAGAAAPPGAPDPEMAAALSKRILLAWADHGFRHAGGFFIRPLQFCGSDGSNDSASMAGVGLQVSRGVIYSVDAQDLLMSIGALNSGEAARVDAFHAAMFDLIRNAHNDWFARPDVACNHYSNHASSHLTGLLAIARLQDDPVRFHAALYGSATPPMVTVSWVDYFEKALYGNGSAPNACFPNSGPNSASSHPSFETGSTVIGEIDDRYRNATPAQGIGYPMFTLELLYHTAEILRVAGFDAYGYRGSQGQSIQAATDYYACYGESAGFEAVVTAENSGRCPNFEQYVGKSTGGVDVNVVQGAQKFPADPTLSRIGNAAKAAASRSAFVDDALLFGRWPG